MTTTLQDDDAARALALGSEVLAALTQLARQREVMGVGDPDADDLRYSLWRLVPDIPRPEACEIARELGTTHQRLVLRRHIDTFGNARGMPWFGDALRSSYRRHGREVDDGLS